jgi:hypothetical protein
MTEHDGDALGSRSECFLACVDRISVLKEAEKSHIRFPDFSTKEDLSCGLQEPLEQLSNRIKIPFMIDDL